MKASIQIAHTPPADSDSGKSTPKTLDALTIPFHLPQLGDEEKAAVQKVMDSGWLTTGPVSMGFEQDFARFTGAPHAIAVNSCTAALHLALEAIGLQPGDEVLTTPYTFAATAEVVRYFDAKPCLIDIDPHTFNLSPEQLEKTKGITWNPAKAKAIIPVHFAGLPCDMDAIMDFAQRNKLYVIEDAAHALPTCYKGRMVGTLGDITAFSFYVTKTITTGEGGMITTAHGELADRMRMMRLHGISRDAWKRYSAEGSWFYEIHQPGFKYNLTDLAAAIGVEQLKKAWDMTKQRVDIAAQYDQAFGQHPALIIPPAPQEDDTTHSRHLYPLRFNPKRLRISRDAFIEEMKAAGIGTSVHFIPLHIHPYYRDTYGYQPEDLPHALNAYQQVMSLPIYSGMTEAGVEQVMDTVLRIANAHLKPELL